MKLRSMDIYMKLLKITLQLSKNKVYVSWLDTRYHKIPFHEILDKYIPFYKFNICRKFEEYNIIDHRPVYDAIREYGYETIKNRVKIW